MKHNIKITIILLSLFLITQFIGLFVVHTYFQEKNALPFGMQSPEIKEEISFWAILPSIIFSFIIAIALIFLLSKYRWNFLIKFWFFSVVLLALGVAINSLFLYFKIFQENFSFFIWNSPLSWFISFLIALPLSYIKVYRPRVILHNLTELFIYPGIACVFIPILNVYTIILILILISIYDIWAVWHSGIMQKMAHYQMQELKIFGGLLIPYLNKKIRNQLRILKTIKQKSKAKNFAKKIKVQMAILGGGDIVFPIITAGVF